MIQPQPRYICIHGHFYQPPRENPWLGQIEEQPGAAPYHDWNARITSECYGPNTSARVVDDKNEILDIRNNFERISFNFGPTLLLWMEEHAPEIYARLLDADRKSRRDRNGHGNAIAQAYSHPILPLADRRDKITQVVWGLEDFRRRFGRDPEGLWLPETAADLDTLDVLADAGVRFTILAPHQAASFLEARADSAALWKTCDKNPIDPTRPYVCSLPGGKSIVLFFYDGPISRAVAFEDLLSNGVHFAQRLMDGFRDDRPWPQILSIATDGETYGHHHRYGEMALAYALYHIKSRGAAQLTNYGEFLDLHPATAEVRIHENTSWSCAHGVERWRSDCGCSISNKPGWNQKWRAPLREAFDALKKRLDDVFELEAARFVRDPWKARDEYIEVVLDRGEIAIDAFLERHARARLRDTQITDLLRLLEMQRHAILMYTSCGWFFDEISGIEATQDLEYASRAIQLASQFHSNIDAEFHRILDDAPSNLMKTGGEVWNLKIRPAVVDLNRVIAHWAISHLYKPAEGRSTLFCYEIEMRGSVFEAFGQTALGVSQIRVFSTIDRSSSESIAAVLHFGGHDFHCALHGPLDPGGYSQLCNDLLETFRRRSLTEVVRTLDERFDAHHYSINDLFAEERRRVLARVTREAFGRFQSVIDLIYDENRRLMEYIRELGAPLPRGFIAAAEQVLTSRIAKAIRGYLSNGEEENEEIALLAKEAKGWNVSLATPSVTQLLQEALHRNVQRLRRHPSDSLYQDMLRLLDVVDSLGVAIDLWEAQNACFCIVYGIPLTQPRSPVTPATREASTLTSPESSIPEPPPEPTPEPAIRELAGMAAADGPGDSRNSAAAPPPRYPVTDTLKTLARRLRISLDSPMRKPEGSRPGFLASPPSGPPPTTRTTE